MKISMIAALDEKNGIGAANQLLWHLPDDFKWFVSHTKGKPVVMGRNTMNSLPKALPNRRNIVLSSRNNGIREGFEHAYSFSEVLEKLGQDTEKLMIIGGAQLYQALLPQADELIITRVHHHFDQADVFFPHWSDSEWTEVYKEHHAKDEKHAYSFDFIIYQRIRNGN